jgi:hypothetical protein
LGKCRNRVEQEKGEEDLFHTLSYGLDPQNVCKTASALPRPVLHFLSCVSGG